MLWGQNAFEFDNKLHFMFPNHRGVTLKNSNVKEPQGEIYTRPCLGVSSAERTRTPWTWVQDRKFRSLFLPTVDE